MNPEMSTPAVIIAQRRQIARMGLYAFFQLYFSAARTVPSGQFHVNLCGWLDKALKPGGRLCGVTAREHSKTTIGTIALVVMCAALGIKKNIVIVGANKEEAAAKLRDIKSQFEENTWLIEDWGMAIAPHVGSDGRASKWSDKEIILANGCKISARAMGDSIRGIIHKNRRVDLIVLDDPENEVDVYVESWRHKMWGWFNASLTNTLGPLGSIIWLGTLVHHDALLQRMMTDKDKKGWGRFNLPAWDADHVSLWPEYWPTERLEARRREIGEPAFNKEFLGIPLSPEQQHYKPENWMRYSRNSLVNRANTWFINLDGKEHPLVVYNGTDPAIKKGLKNDFFANITLARCPALMRWYVLDAINLRLDFSGQLATLKGVAMKWHPILAGSEDVAYQSVLVQAASELYDVGMPMIPISHGMAGKHPQIQATAVYQQRRQIYIPDDGDPVIAQLVEQGAQYDAGKYDDLLDALAIAMKTAQGGGGLTEPILINGRRVDGVMQGYFGEEQAAGLHDPNRFNQRRF